MVGSTYTTLRSKSQCPKTKMSFGIMSSSVGLGTAVATSLRLCAKRVELHGHDDSQADEAADRSSGNR